MNRKQKTFNYMLVRNLLVSAFLLLCFGAFFGAQQIGAPEASPSQGWEADISRPAAPGSPDVLIAEHDCWTGEAPADMTGKIPGHVVASRGSTPVYGGSRLVRLSLEQIFEGKQHGITVYGFCR